MKRTRHVHIRPAARCLDGVDADPLGVHAHHDCRRRAVRHLRRISRCNCSLRMERWFQRQQRIHGCIGARAFILVLLSLLGLLALGVMYGNVLGAVHASP